MPRVFLIRRHLADLIEFEEDDVDIPVYDRRIIAGDNFLCILGHSILFRIICMIFVGSFTSPLRIL